MAPKKANHTWWSFEHAMILKYVETHDSFLNADEKELDNLCLTHQQLQKVDSLMSTLEELERISLRVR